MKYVRFILFFLCVGNAFGQNQQIVDSLNQELTLTKQDTARVLILTELAYQYRFANTDTAMKHGQNALIL
ncbi:MAG TPA: hypothetical protein VK666_15430 [Chryseolinea sp.]|nr:hypothetical protein [Chryseolinea sp.]